MTNYNDGKWHSWNGGECPVLPNLLVQWRHTPEINDGNKCLESRAANVNWWFRGAFRIVSASHEGSKMTNYNDGKWHRWNGGECPVHPKSAINILFDDKSGTGVAYAMPAGEFLWSGNIAPCAFRVVMEYRDPRERWAYLTHMHDSLAEAEAFRAQVDAANPGRGYLDTPITHWREVVD